MISTFSFVLLVLGVLFIVFLLVFLPTYIVDRDYDVDTGRSTRLPWLHKRFCVCHACTTKIIKEQRAAFEKRYAEQIYRNTVNKVVSELREEYKKYE